ncbi:MAG: tetratricopeptide repeat protein [Polyangiales bacterium]
MAAVSSATTDILRNELERLYDLDALQRISGDLLGFSPESFEGESSKQSYARALAERCVRDELHEALADAILLTDRAAELRLRPVYEGRAADDLAPGTVIDGFKVLKKQADEGLSTVFLATEAGGRQVNLKVLRESHARDRRALHRFLVAQRALRAIDDPAVQKILGAGLLPDGRPYVATEHVDGQLLSSRLARAGAMHINEAKGVLQSICEALDKVHAAGLAHGDIRTEHVVLVRKEGQLSGVLVDFAVDRLAGARPGGHDAVAFLQASGARAIAPERIRKGTPADVGSDVYALGTMVYEVLTGKPAFAAASGADLIIAQLTHEPEAPSKIAPRGWVSKDLDGVVMASLAKEPEARPASAGGFFDALLEAVKGRRAGDITREEFDARVAALKEAVGDDDKALAVEAAGGHGVAWSDVCDALREVAESTDDLSAKRALRFRVARILEAEVKDLPQARAAYLAIAEMEGGDELAKARAKEIRRATATAEERAEMILEEVDEEPSATERARLYRDLGRLYEKELHDAENAGVAFTQAVLESPADDELAAEIERLNGDDTARWGEALATLSEAIKGREPADAVPLYLRAGKWYLTKVSRSDFALACFTQAIALSPGNDDALECAEGIYRKAQQWPELIGVLLKRADAQAAPAQGLRYRAEAADLVDARVNDAAKARELAEAVLAVDAAEPKAVEVLERILLRLEDWPVLVELLERKADALEGSAKAEALCEIAEVYEDHISDTAKAAAWYEKARGADASNLLALKGLERLYARQGDHAKHLEVIEAQVAVAATPRQKVELHLRVGAMVEEEFVDHARASTAFEAALELDPGNDEALRGLGRVYRVLGRWEDLASLLERHATLIDDAAKRTEVLLSAARVLLDPIGSLDRAQRCFERVLEVDKDHAGALEGLARVAAQKGDVRGATEAYDRLAAGAKDDDAKVEILLTAARVLEEKGDRDGAIDRYKQALDVNPDSGAATSRLRELYASRGDAQGAIELLQREIEAAEGTNARASLWAQVARIYRDSLKDPEKARDAAEKAYLLDGTSEDAAAMLGELRFDEGKWEEAAKLLGPRASRAAELPREEGLRVALRYGEALARNGENARALDALRAAGEIAPDDRDVQLAVARATYNVEAWTEARERYETLFAAHGDALDKGVRGGALYEYADAARRTGEVEKALKLLGEALELNPGDLRSMDLAVSLYSDEGRWDEVVRLKRARLELATTDAQRAELLPEIAELTASKLGEKSKAARVYLQALEHRPDDRKVLMRLMQLYSDEKDWGRLVEIILKFTDLVEDDARLAKYYLTAAQLCDKHLDRPEEAVDYYEQALERDPSLTLALDGLTTLQGDRGEWAGLEQGLRRVLAKLPEGASASARASLHARIGAIAEDHLGQLDEAIVGYERAMELCPAEHDYREKLASLYLGDPKRYQDRAITVHRELLARNPLRVESLHALRAVFTSARRPDEAWCMCQALVSVRAAEPEEESFFKKFRPEGPAAAQEKLNDERWAKDLVHPMQEGVITSIFSTILPAVLKSRAQPLSMYGLSESARIDPATDDGQAAQTIHYAAGTFGMKTPPTYANPGEDSGITIALSDPPALLLGATALAGGPDKAMAFLAGARLSYFRPGHFARQVIPTGTGLRAWLFAAIRAVQPTFPVSADLIAPVNENLAAVKAHLSGQAMEVLTSLVSKLLAAGNALDLRRWLAGVDLTADRAGFVLANDLAMAIAVIKATPEEQSSVTHAERVRELRAYAVSEEYMRLRQRLGVAMSVAS